MKAVLRPIVGADLASIVDLLSPDCSRLEFFWDRIEQGDIPTVLREDIRIMLGGGGVGRVLQSVGRPSWLFGYASIVHGRLAYAIHPSMRRRGYAIVLVHEICRDFISRSDGRRALASVRRDNVSSRYVLEKVGFRFLGNAHRTRGSVLDFSLSSAPDDPSIRLRQRRLDLAVVPDRRSAPSMTVGDGADLAT